MKVEQACRLSADGTARAKARVRNEEGDVYEVSLYARYNEIQDRYTVTQYFNRQKTETFRQFRNPHEMDQWRPSRRFSGSGHEHRRVKSEYCLYLLISRDKYRFHMGITNNIYSRVYQLRLLCGEFDLDTSCVVYGEKNHLEKLENILCFIFEEYQLETTESSGVITKNWFDLDCFWYAKNEIRRLNSFRQEKIYRLFESIDLNAFIVEDSQRLAVNVDTKPVFDK